ncbi:MAG: hypothetical protein J2P57_09390 [Acidimicrobiaceae bacterium]|nr:hypothetical protein [Acidimicrobiaceae bacterium]
MEGWTLADRSWRIRNGADQGLTTVVAPAGGSSLLYRGTSSVPTDLRTAGWNHIGDPDSASGYIFDCFQGHGDAKLFTATDPSGNRSNYLHTLDRTLHPAELSNNSYIAVAPGGQWMVSGEWFTMNRLLVYPTPVLNPSATARGAKLPLAAVVRLNRCVRNVQGAAFIGDRTIVCSTDDLSPAQCEWPVPQQLLQIQLDAPLDGSDRQGIVTCMGQLPGGPPGVGHSEVEGCDYDHQTGDLRVLVIPKNPLGRLLVVTYRYRRNDSSVRSLGDRRHRAR